MIPVNLEVFIEHYMGVPNMANAKSQPSALKEMQTAAKFQKCQSQSKHHQPNPKPKHHIYSQRYALKGRIFPSQKSTE